MTYCIQRLVVAFLGALEDFAPGIMIGDIEVWIETYEAGLSTGLELIY